MSGCGKKGCCEKVIITKQGLRGPQGPVGPPGPRGLQGPAGSSPAQVFSYSETAQGTVDSYDPDAGWTIAPSLAPIVVPSSGTYEVIMTANIYVRDFSLACAIGINGVQDQLTSKTHSWIDKVLRAEGTAIVAVKSLTAGQSISAMFRSLLPGTGGVLFSQTLNVQLLIRKLS